MSLHLFSENTRNTALAALAGVAAATVVKLLLDEATEYAVAASASPRSASSLVSDKYQQMRAAAHDPQYLADMQAVNDDFAFADAEAE